MDICKNSPPLPKKSIQMTISMWSMGIGVTTRSSIYSDILHLSQQDIVVEK